MKAFDLDSLVETLRHHRAESKLTTRLKNSKLLRKAGAPGVICPACGMRVPSLAGHQCAYIPRFKRRTYRATVQVELEAVAGGWTEAQRRREATAKMRTVLANLDLQIEEEEEDVH